MKKILIINVVLVMIFTLSMCGCSKKETKVKSVKKEKVVQNKEKDVVKKEINDFLDDYYDRYTGLYLKSKKFLKTLESLWYNIKDVYFKCCKDGDGILSAV